MNMGDRIRPIQVRGKDEPEPPEQTQQEQDAMLQIKQEVGIQKVIEIIGDFPGLMEAAMIGQGRHEVAVYATELPQAEVAAEALPGKRLSVSTLYITKPKEFQQLATDLRTMFNGKAQNLLMLKI